MHKMYRNAEFFPLVLSDAQLPIAITPVSPFCTELSRSPNIPHWLQPYPSFPMPFQGEMHGEAAQRSALHRPATRNTALAAREITAESEPPSKLVRAGAAREGEGQGLL